ncbi:hypothetical protein I2494_10745 [Budviciaceae bacterium BWR-B9]|uniref:Uncharacterized protein n=1 Tax=Limnobaculum allomyrinae TaxID=2791986 RepID=A0ABS1IR41_9GAMM|nr:MULTISPECIES: hypothetical protein [Limnobaculum]MBK5144189.1 hypothetical protein [Limnobaculum allomyrinae]MBV7692067.1 hypothetical protein [Limnobaculum sp. M2-1]
MKNLHGRGLSGNRLLAPEQRNGDLLSYSGFYLARVQISVLKNTESNEM